MTNARRLPSEPSLDFPDEPSRSRRRLLGSLAASYPIGMAALALPNWAAAQLTIEIIGGGADQIPITIVPFGAEEHLPQPLTAVISADLARSGRFRLQPPGSLRPLPTEPAEVDYKAWSAQGAQTMVIGRTIERNDGKVEVRFRLLDTAKASQLLGFSYTVAKNQTRAIAHKIADLIYEKLTGEPGVFSTRIAYVARNPNRFELHVADADGFNSQFILAHREPIISPAWSPDGSRIAYVSFEQRKAIIFVHDLVAGQRRIVANYDGSNLARITNSDSIDTEPSFSPDGKHVLFTSDRGGSPQIYRMRTNGSGVERITFEGSYNVTPRYAPDGRAFAFIQRAQGRYSLATMDFSSRQTQILTDGQLDGSPTFAPNGRMLLYASIVRGRGVLAAVSSDGRIRQKITASAQDVREPAWGPLGAGH